MPKKSSEPKPIGEVTHFYGHLNVAIVKFNKAVKVGARVKFKGVTTDFDEMISSMQFEHKPIEASLKGQEVGIKVSQKVREGAEAFDAE